MTSLKLLLVSTAFIFTTASTFAADYGGPGDPPVIYAGDAEPDESYDWSGYVMGVQGGWAIQDAFIDPSATSQPEVSGDGALYGGFIGVQQQYGNLVIGFDADILFGEIAFDDKSKAKVNHMVRVNSKIGHAFSAAGLNMMVSMGTGVSHSNIKTDTRDTEGSMFGVAFNAGVDLAITDNVILGAQYVRDEFFEQTVSNLETATSDGLFMRLSLKF